MNPFISFIIPYFNIPENLLKECVDSIMALKLQSHEREVIVIDDGSEIHAKDILQKYNTSCTIVRQENKGLSEARNSGLELAKGEYVQFVDADDKLIDYIYNKCIDSLRKNSPDILKFHYIHNPKPLDKELNESLYESGSQFMSQNNLETGACAYVFKRSILKTLRFTPGIFHEDEEFTPLLFLRAGKTVITDATPYFYYQRPDSIVSSISETLVQKRLDDFYAVILRLNNLKHNLGNSDVDAYSLKALTRKVDQASMDYIINVIRLHKQLYNPEIGVSKSKYISQSLSNHLNKMSSDGLFPLNKAKYTRNYSIFRILVNNPLLRKLFYLKNF